MKPLPLNPLNKVQQHMLSTAFDMPAAQGTEQNTLCSLLNAEVA